MIGGGWWQVFRWSRLREYIEDVVEEARRRRREREELVSWRWTPAWSPMVQLRRSLAELARVTYPLELEHERASGFRPILFMGKRVPEELSPEVALEMLNGRHHVA